MNKSDAGRLGGLATAKNRTKKQRSEAARKAAIARHSVNKTHALAACAHCWRSCMHASCATCCTCGAPSPLAKRRR